MWDFKFALFAPCIRFFVNKDFSLVRIGRKAEPFVHMVGILFCYSIEISENASLMHIVFAQYYDIDIEETV